MRAGFEPPKGLSAHILKYNCSDHDNMRVSRHNIPPPIVDLTPQIASKLWIRRRARPVLLVSQKGKYDQRQLAPMHASQRLLDTPDFRGSRRESRILRLPQKAIHGGREERRLRPTGVHPASAIPTRRRAREVLLRAQGGRDGPLEQLRV